MTETLVSKELLSRSIFNCLKFVISFKKNIQ